MANFFDSGKQADRDLLHSSVRDHAELPYVVNSVEWEIIDYYKQRPDVPLFFRSGYENLSTLNEIDVRLIDYKEDDPTGSDADLIEALRRTIADVASWVLRNYDTTQGINSIKQGQRSITYMGNAPSWRDWPDGWNHKLRNFDDREAVYSI